MVCNIGCITGGGLQKGCLRRNQVANNEEANNNNESQSAHENKERLKEIAKNMLRDSNDLPESIDNES